MKCRLCDNLIKNYNPEFNRLEIDGSSHSVDICTNCVDKFIMWQKNIYARLFPTAVIKKIYGKKK